MSLALTASPFLGAWKYNNLPSGSKGWLNQRYSYSAQPKQSTAPASIQETDNTAPSVQAAEVNPQPVHYKVLVLKEANDGGSVTVPLHQKISVRLSDSSGSTGYLWTYDDLKPQALQFKGDGEFNPAVMVPGRPSTKFWNFTTIAPGQTTLTFSLQQPWQKNIAPVKQVSFTINVEEAPASSAKSGQ